ncbi:zinc ribbon domain-containing protein [Clostridium chromiireducens]|uniref:zinc ribbon domain-containing protein n=1 Tax=Clostridium chromiireducens TaxID=225345 RepID=UPI001FAAB031|nr:zinc ribbon domain-containing protein [Clostridium chromiireducens]
MKISHWIQCTNCYKGWKVDLSQYDYEEMIELIVPELGRAIGEEEARKEMTALLPTLKRWKEA